MPIELGNTQLTVGKLVQIARFGEKVELHRDAVDRREDDDEDEGERG